MGLSCTTQKIFALHAWYELGSKNYKLLKNIYIAFSKRYHCTQWIEVIKTCLPNYFYLNVGKKSQRKCETYLLSLSGLAVAVNMSDRSTEHPLFMFCIWEANMEVARVRYSLSFSEHWRVALRCPHSHEILTCTKFLIKHSA